MARDTRKLNFRSAWKRNKIVTGREDGRVAQPVCEAAEDHGDVAVRQVYWAGEAGPEPLEPVPLVSALGWRCGYCSWAVVKSLERLAVRRRCDCCW